MDIRSGTNRSSRWTAEAYIERGFAKYTESDYSAIARCPKPNFLRETPEQITPGIADLLLLDEKPRRPFKEFSLPQAMKYSLGRDIRFIVIVFMTLQIFLVLFRFSERVELHLNPRTLEIFEEETCFVKALGRTRCPFFEALQEEASIHWASNWLDLVW